MRRICQECGQLFGFKKPMDDDSETYGICEECFPIVMKNFEQKLREVAIERYALQVGKENEKD